MSVGGLQVANVQSATKTATSVELGVATKHNGRHLQGSSYRAAFTGRQSQVGSGETAADRLQIPR